MSAAGGTQDAVTLGPAPDRKGERMFGHPCPRFGPPAAHDGCSYPIRVMLTSSPWLVLANCGKIRRGLAGMRQRRVMFSDAAWDLIQREARDQGISASQLVREAALAHAIWMSAQRGGDSSTQQVEAIIQQLRDDQSSDR